MNIKQKIIRFLRENQRSMSLFVLVGASAAFVNFTAFALFWNLLAMNYHAAASIAYVLSVVFHFNANRYFTFQSRDTFVLPQIIKYVTVTVGNYLITVATVHTTVEALHLSPYLGICLAIGLTMVTGYFMGRFWIFKPQYKFAED